MSVQPSGAAPLRPVVRARNFLGYAFLISFLIHLVTVPFFHLKSRSQDKSEVEKVSVTKKIKVVVPTPPPPTPTPPPPTPKPACPVPNADATTVSAVEPDYPDIARQQGAVGTAKIKVSLDAAGHVLDVALAKSSGNASLDQSALKAARASTFAPEVVNCVKTAGVYLFTADFQGQ
ncbi:MAG: hypothetical protein NVSMB21_08590 [Vulcanimicrobiaceae bacterium]